jgi:hypothetical protein
MFVFSYIYEQLYIKKIHTKHNDKTTTNGCAWVEFLTAETWAATNGCATTCSILPKNDKTNKLSKEKCDNIILKLTLKEQHMEYKEMSSVLKKKK